MPIGSDARYVPANLPTVPQGDKWAPMPQNDANSIVFTPDAPMTDIYYSNAGWTGRNRCTKTGSLLSQVPIPPNFIVENSPQNEGAAFLMPNGRTINLSVPLARCNEGGYATSIDTGTSIDLYGNGFSSGIGAGGLTGNPGGVLRIGELRPGQQGPRHALRIVVGSAQSLYNCTSEVECWRWPATGADSGATSTYGRYGNNQNRAMRMGALLAIPTSTNIDGMGLETEPGRQLAWTLQNYGAYIGDATGAGFEFVTERGPNGAFADQAEHDYGPDRRDTQFFQDWGFNFEQRVANNTPWSRDVQRLVGALYVVDNNGPTSVGGGGSPLQPLAPAISPGR